MVKVLNIEIWSPGEREVPLLEGTGVECQWWLVQIELAAGVHALNLFACLNFFQYAAFCRRLWFSQLASLQLNVITTTKYNIHGHYRYISTFWNIGKLFVFCSENNLKTFRIILLQRNKKFRCVIIFLRGMQ